MTNPWIVHSSNACDYLQSMVAKSGMKGFLPKKITWTVKGKQKTRVIASRLKWIAPQIYILTERFNLQGNWYLQLNRALCGVYNSTYEHRNVQEWRRMADCSRGCKIDQLSCWVFAPSHSRGEDCCPQIWTCLGNKQILFADIFEERWKIFGQTTRSAVKNTAVGLVCGLS